MSTISNNYPKRLSEYALGVADGADTLTQALANSRRVLSILSPILQSVCRGPDWTNISCVRVTDKKIVLFVPNALQKTKLRQVLPRLEAALQEKGFVLALDIVVRPTVKPLDVGAVPSTSPARTGPKAWKRAQKPYAIRPCETHSCHLRRPCVRPPERRFPKRPFQKAPCGAVGYSVRARICRRCIWRKGGTLGRTDPRWNPGAYA